MKKLMFMLLTLALVGLTAVAFAADPTVSFVDRTGTVSGGYDYKLEIKINRAPAADLPVEIINNATGETMTLTIYAGDTTADVIIPTEVVAAKTTVTFSFLPGDGYDTGSMHTLTVNQLPKIQFYSAVTHGYVGDEMSVLVLCNNPGVVQKNNNVFTLKDHTGRVLAEKQWSNPRERTSFKFTVTEDMVGKVSFTVWLGDYMVSPDDGYGVVDIKSNPALTQLETDLPLMAIGIDCGFAAKKTDDILAVLEKHNVKVTFFMTGYWLREFPEDVKKIYAAGHEIASHSNTHKHLKELSTHNQYLQITKPIEEAEALLGVTPRLFRPPYGEYNKYITGISRAEGMEVVMWGPTYHDSTGKYTKAQILRCATTENDYKPGTIVLCHVDGYYQPESLEAGLTYYEELGLQVVPISALIYASGRELPAMPHDREALVYTDEYWSTWLEREGILEKLAQAK